MQTDRLSSALLVLFLVLAIVGAGFAVQYRRQLGELRGQMTGPDKAIGESRRTGVGMAATGSTNGPGNRGGSGRVFELLDLLDKKDAAIDQLKRETRQPSGKRPPSLRSRDSVVPRHAAKESGPKRVANDLAMFANLPKNIGPRFADEIEFFRTMDVSRISADQISDHRAMQRQLTDMKDVLAVLAADPTSLHNEDVQREVRRSVQGLNVLLRGERSIIFYNTGLSLGYDDDGAREFANWMAYIDEMTSMELLLKRTKEASQDSNIAEPRVP